MDVKLRTYLAETFGTFVLVVVAAGAVCSAHLPDAAPDSPRWYGVSGLTIIAALADGFALAVAVSFTSYLSPGCCNPAITLALFITRKLDLRPTLSLILAQLTGSFFAGLLLRGLYVPDVLARASMGAPHLGAAIVGDGPPTLAAKGVGILLEALFAFVVTMAAFATLIDKRAPRLGGLGVGMAQTAVVLFGYHLTGGSANPARWFGPTVWRLSLGVHQQTPILSGHAAYWAGPVLGAMAAAVLYVAVILPPDRK